LLREGKSERELIRLRVPLIIGIEDERPVELTFTSTWLSTTHHFTYGFRESDEGYRFLVFLIQARNLGPRTVTPVIVEGFEVLADNGYIYSEIDSPTFGLRPGESKVDYLIFEILSSVNPVQLVWNDRSRCRKFVMDLREEYLS